MKPVFPEKNLAVNNLIEFRSPEIIYEFTSHFEQIGDIVEGDNLNFKINHFKELFPFFNRAINQLIYTSTDQIKIAFFEELKETINDHQLLRTDKEFFLPIIEHWNEEKLEEFTNEVTKRAHDFQSSEQRKKYKHNEEFEKHSFAFGHYKKFKAINRHFYCVEETPKLINVEYLDRYLVILAEVTNMFKNFFQTELKLYESGKLISQPKQHNLYDKIVEKFKNNKLVVGILIGLLVFEGISEVIKLTKENRENLVGKEGLINQTDNDTMPGVTRKKDSQYQIVHDTIYLTPKPNSKKP